MIPALTKGGGPWRPWPVASKTGVGSSMGAPNPCLEHKICPWILIRAKTVGKNVWLHVGANPATDQTKLARATVASKLATSRLQTFSAQNMVMV